MQRGGNTGIKDPDGAARPIAAKQAAKLVGNSHHVIGISNRIERPTGPRPLLPHRLDGEAALGLVPHRNELPQHGSEIRGVPFPCHVGLAEPEPASFRDPVEQGIRMDHEVTVKTNRKPGSCLLYTSPSPRDRTRSRMPSSA